MPVEHRHDVRYSSSKSAVLLTEWGDGRLCVITNLSNGGLCLAVIGSHGSWQRESINVKINRGTFLLNVVGSGREGLHCKFRNRNEKRDIWKIFPSIEVRNGEEMLAIERNRESLQLHYHNNYENDASGLAQCAQADRELHRYNMSLIYMEGCLAGCERSGLVIDTVETTMDMLNPYRAPEERKRWGLGFKDGVLQVG